MLLAASSPEGTVQYLLTCLQCVRLQSVPVVLRRSAWQRAQGNLRLPRAATRSAARQ